MNELKPCPFCGGEALVNPAFIRPGYRVYCENDCSSMPSRPDIAFTSEKEAIKRWNTRPDKPEPITVDQLLLFMGTLKSVKEIADEINAHFLGKE